MKILTKMTMPKYVIMRRVSPAKWKPLESCVSDACHERDVVRG